MLHVVQIFVAEAWGLHIIGGIIMTQSIILFAVALAVILLVLKLIGKSVKILIGILVNSLVGFIVLFILNALGFGVAVNWISALIVGLLGIPGLIIVLILQLGFRILL